MAHKLHHIEMKHLPLNAGIHKIKAASFFFFFFLCHYVLRIRKPSPKSTPYTQDSIGKEWQLGQHIQKSRLFVTPCVKMCIATTKKNKCKNNFTRVYQKSEKCIWLHKFLLARASIASLFLKTCILNAKHYIL